jgi:pyruvate dehydrogenase E1 component beta subunit
VAHKTGGAGAEIAQQITELAFDHLEAPVRRVAALDNPVPASQPLEAQLFPGTDDLVEACRALG